MPLHLIVRFFFQKLQPNTIVESSLENIRVKVKLSAFEHDERSRVVLEKKSKNNPVLLAANRSKDKLQD